MDHVLIERVLLGRLRAYGLDHCEIALLERARRIGSPTAQRLLDDAAQSPVHTDMPRKAGHGHLPADYDAIPVTAAAVSIGGGYGWYMGNLLDPARTIPKTIALGCIGAPIGRLIDHRDIAPEILIHQSEHQSPAVIAAIPAELVHLEIPRFPIGRLRLARRLLEKRKSDRSSIAWATKAYAICAMVSLAAFLSRLVFPASESVLNQVLTMMMGISTSIIIIMAFDSYLSGVILQFFSNRARRNHEVAAGMRHDFKMYKLLSERGYGDHGQPFG